MNFLRLQRNPKQKIDRLFYFASVLRHTHTAVFIRRYSYIGTHTSVLIHRYSHTEVLIHRHFIQNTKVLIQRYILSLYFHRALQSFFFSKKKKKVFIMVVFVLKFHIIYALVFMFYIVYTMIFLKFLLVFNFSYNAFIEKKKKKSSLFTIP
jgi:hypothetical protein